MQWDEDTGNLFYRITNISIQACSNSYGMICELNKETKKNNPLLKIFHK